MSRGAIWPMPTRNATGVRIYRDFANALIVEARRLYAGDAFGVDLENTVYALDTTTIVALMSQADWPISRPFL
jgi:hypothetical protein